MKKLFSYFSKFEILLWSSSVILIAASFLAFDRSNYLSLVASVIGITSLIFFAKGNAFGNVLMIVFSILYGIISYSFAYYGEMITYLGMTLPMAVFALISWVCNPYSGGKHEVRVGSVGKAERILICIAAVPVTLSFYFILKHFGTSNLLPSTFSVTTSFLAAYLTFRRSVYYALAYAVNDVVLIVLWTLASFADLRYVSVAVCFAAFLANDIYGFISWQKMKKRQSK